MALWVDSYAIVVRLQERQADILTHLPAELLDEYEELDAAVRQLKRMIHEGRDSVKESDLSPRLRNLVNIREVP